MPPPEGPSVWQDAHRGQPKEARGSEIPAACLCVYIVGPERPSEKPADWFRVLLAGAPGVVTG